MTSRTISTHSLRRESRDRERVPPSSSSRCLGTAYKKPQAILYVDPLDSGTANARRGFRKFDPPGVEIFLGDPQIDRVLQIFTTYTPIEFKHVIRLIMRLTVSCNAKPRTWSDSLWAIDAFDRRIIHLI